MSDIESVRVNCTLKMGKVVYWEGQEFRSPDIPADLLSEAEAGRETVSVTLKPPPPPPKTKEDKTKPTTVAKVTAKPKLKRVRKPKKKEAAKKK